MKRSRPGARTPAGEIEAEGGGEIRKYKNNNGGGGGARGESNEGPGRPGGKFGKRDIYELKKKKRRKERKRKRKEENNPPAATADAA